MSCLAKVTYHRRMLPYLIIGMFGVTVMTESPAPAQTTPPLTPSRIDVASPHAVTPQPSLSPTPQSNSGRSKDLPRHKFKLDDQTRNRLASSALTAPAPSAPQTQLSLADDKGGASKPARTQVSLAGANQFMFELAPLDPPDTTLAASANRVIEAVNSGLRITDFGGKSEQRIDLASFFGEAQGEFMFDPRVIYDRNSPNQRFIVATLHRPFNTPEPESWLHVAVSRSAQPATLNPADWCTYKIDARHFDPDIDGQGNPGYRWADFTRMGTGPDALLVTTNEFPFGNIGGILTQLRVLNKTLLENNAAACPAAPVYTFDLSSQQENLTSSFTAFPVQHYTNPSSFSGTSNPAYLIGNGLFATRDYTIWRVKNVATGSPTVDFIHVNSDIMLPLSPPPPAKQLGTVNLLESGDPRISGTAAIGDALWATHGNTCNVGGGEEESCVVVLRFTVGQDTAGRMTAAISQSHTFGGAQDGVSFWMPGIAVTQQEQTVVTFQTSSPTSYLSTWYTSKNLTDPAYQTPTVLTTGTCAIPDQPPFVFEARTGDYVGAMSAPDLKSVWIAGERLIPFPPEFGVNSCIWDTWIGRVGP